VIVAATNVLSAINEETILQEEDLGDRRGVVTPGRMLISI
jgi:hypothetical protein